MRHPNIPPARIVSQNFDLDPSCYFMPKERGNLRQRLPVLVHFIFIDFLNFIKQNLEHVSGSLHFILFLKRSEYMFKMWKVGMQNTA